MKAISNRLLFLFMIALALLPFCRAQYAQDSDSPRIQRLADLAKVWCLVKNTHPYLAYRQDIDWDEALIQTLPRVQAAHSQEEYIQALDFMLGFLKDPATHFVQPASGTSSPQTNFARSSNTPEDNEPVHPYLRWGEENTAIVVANDYEKMAARKDLTEAFRKIFKEAARADSLLLDLRSFHGAVGWIIGISLEQAFPSLLTTDLELPAISFVHRFGYSPQSEGTPKTFGYYSELVTRSQGVIRANSPSPNRLKRMVFLLNGQSADVSDVLMTLQEKGLAFIIHEGERPEPENTETASVFDIGGGIRLRLRHAELLSQYGEAQFTPDQILNPVSTSGPDEARRVALEALKHWRTSRLASRAGSGADRSAFSQQVFFADRSYSDLAYPDSQHRMLALFRLWGVIEYFFAYKDLMDQPWDKTLTEFIPKMEAARNATEYALTIAEMTARIQDSHGMITGKTIDDYFGVFRPPLRVRSVQGETVVTEVDDSIRGKTELQIGDSVVSVDDEDIAKRRERLARYLPASTPGRLRDKVDITLLRGRENSDAALRIRDKQGNVKDVKLSRNADPLLRSTSTRRTPLYGTLPNGYGYVDLDRLTTQDVNAAFSAIQNTPGLILDMRGYPLGGSFGFASQLAREKKVAAQFEFPEWDGASGTFLRRSEQQYVDPAPGPKYTGKVVVLINEGAQSAAEHTCLHLEAATRVTFIGTPTSGANGNVSFTLLPGGITVRFTGLAVRHGDGRQLQRVGIQPDIRVEPTIEGIRQGRDEVLERAVAYLKDGR